MSRPISRIGPQIGDELNEAAVQDLAGIQRQTRGQRLAAVVIARHDQDGNAEAVEHGTQDGILLRQPAIGQVSGDHQQIGAGREPGNDVEGALAQRIGLGDAIGGLAARADVQVGDLGDEHGFLPGRMGRVPLPLVGRG